MDPRTALTGLDLATELPRLGFREQDVPVVVGWRDEVARGPQADLDRLAELVGRLGGVLDHPERIDEVYDEVDATHRLGRGVLPTLAMLLTADAVRARLAERGVPAEVADASLADLGQQVWKDRQVNGSTGLHNHGWLTRVWTGQYLKLGRLQFELTRSTVGLYGEPVRVLSVHIDEAGPLAPEEVDDSLVRATTFFEEHYPELAPIDFFVCGSWLLDPGLAVRMPGSNVADFAARWTIWKAEPNSRDALYFGFGIEPADRDAPVDVDALPADTALRRAAIDIWRDGEEPMLCWGRIPVPSEELADA